MNKKSVCTYEVKWNIISNLVIDPNTFEPISHERVEVITKEYCSMYEKWCKENCEGEWKWQSDPRAPNAHPNPDIVTWCWMYFELETDAMAFKLAWA